MRVIQRYSAEEILEICVQDIQAAKLSTEDCLERYPDLRDELAPLLNLSEKLHEGYDLEASDEFRHVAYTRMQNLISARSKPEELAQTTPLWTNVMNFFRQPSGIGRTVRLGVTIFAVTVLCFVILGSGLLQVSAKALPGSWLYPAKVALEDIQLAFTPSDIGDSRLHMEFASRRLNEAGTLLDLNDEEHIDEVLGFYSDQVSQALNGLNDTGGITPEEQIELATWLITNLSRYEEILLAILEFIPGENLASLEDALEISHSSQALVVELLQSRYGDFEGISDFIESLPMQFRISSDAQSSPYPIYESFWWPTEYPQYNWSAIPTYALTSYPTSIYLLGPYITPAEGWVDDPSKLPYDESTWPSAWPTAPEFPTFWPPPGEFPTFWPTAPGIFPTDEPPAPGSLPGGRPEPTPPSGRGYFPLPPELSP